LRGPGPDGNPILFNGDTVVLDGGEQRNDLNCTVTPEKAVLGFDLKFHAGYSVSLPLRELQGPGNRLSILFRVIPQGAAQGAPASQPVYLGQRVRVPPITETSGEVGLDGGFDVGQGSYHVAWLMRDNAGRYCSSQWDLEAALTPKDKDITVALPPLTVRHSEDEQFQPEPPVERAGDDSALNV